MVSSSYLECGTCVPHFMEIPNHHMCFALPECLYTSVGVCINRTRALRSLSSDFYSVCRTLVTILQHIFITQKTRDCSKYFKRNFSEDFNTAIKMKWFVAGALLVILLSHTYMAEQVCSPKITVDGIV